MLLTGDETAKADPGERWRWAPFGNRAGAALLVAAAGLAVCCPADARAVAAGELPPQAQQTYRTVLAGGPFPGHKDGVVFGNRERLLPSKMRGYYREYMVSTPGVRGRGGRRIVCGGERPAIPDACFYTADHYASFSRITP